MRSPIAKSIYNTYAEKPESSNDVETERANAKAAIDAGAPADVVKQRFKQKTGQEL
jgi:hypothetical protein